MSYNEWTVQELETWADRLREALDKHKVRTILDATRMAEYERDLRAIKAELERVNGRHHDAKDT